MAWGLARPGRSQLDAIDVTSSVGTRGSSTAAGWGGGELNGSSQSQLALAKTIPLAHIQNGVFETGWGAAVHEHGGLEYLAEKKTQGLGGGASAPSLRSLIPIQEDLKTKKSVLKKK